MSLRVCIQDRLNDTKVKLLSNIWKINDQKKGMKLIPK
jgi:hypothetical protein